MPRHSPISGGIRILVCQGAPARTFGLVALSAAFMAVGAGDASATEAGQRRPGWTATSVRFEPLDPAGGGLTLVGNGSYRGSIDVGRNGRSLAVVNDVGFEDYVRGIDEVPSSWPAAALRAQAVAARTYAAYWAQATEATPWGAVGAHICATQRCQVYRGLDMERKALGHGWLPAVEATAGQLLLEGNRPLFASYSSRTDSPRAMSQFGALAMARDGRSAADILESFYGIRPTAAAGRLPATIRVALATSSATVRISATSPFLVLDGDGLPLAASGAGEWTVLPEGEGVRVLPPEDFAPESVGLDAPAGVVGSRPVPAEASLAALRAPGPRPGRVLTAAAAPVARTAWAAVALTLLLAAGSGAVTLARGRLD